MPAHDRIHEFVADVRARLEQLRMIRFFAAALLAVAAVLVGWCLIWVLQGYAVPKMGLAVTAAVVGLVVLLLAGWLWGRTPREKAALMADGHFGLKDALMSFLGFSKEQRDGEFHRLHAEQTAQRVQGLSARAIPLIWPVRVLSAAVVLLGASALLGSRDASPLVLERLAVESETDQKTAEINEELEKQIEGLLKDATDEEKELLKPDEWRKWVKELEQTKDRKEAMRQYAELERKVMEAAQKLSMREQEQLLSKAGEELKQEAELKETGRKMEEKKLREAAADLQKMQVKADVSKPDEARKELAKLKAAAQRMAAAARQHQQRSGKQGSGQQQASQSKNSAAGNNKSGQQSQANGQSGSPGEASLDQQMVALDEAAQNYEKALNQNPNSSECKGAKQNLNAQLAKLCQSMGKCATQRDLMKKLTALSQCAGQCQGYLNKQSESLSQCLSAKPGGKKAGQGSVESRREGSELTQDNGNRDQLQGTKGSGPSNTSIEAADNGSGVATRQAKVADRELQRQVESFIQREDVPAEVKEGVKEYFKGIQQVGSEGA